MKDGYKRYCKTCNKKRKKEYYERYPDEQKNRKLKRKYGITLDEYNLMFLKQQGNCLICSIHQSILKRPLVVDHCHNTGKVRGLLCSNCNTALGLLKEDEEIIKNLLEYIGYYNGKNRNNK